MNLEVELYALNENAKVAYANAIERGSDCTLSRSQVVGVIILMKAGLESDERPMRISVLKLLVGHAVQNSTGYVLNTTNKLTGPIANFLIDLIAIPREDEEDPLELNEYGQILLERCEAHVERRSANSKVGKSRTKVLPGVRSVSEADHERS